MAVSFVAAGTTYSATGGGTSFTLNAPAGVAAGDRMYALVACWANGSQKTISATGWTVLNTAYRDAGSDEIQLTVLHRLYQTGDPSSWTATASGTVYLRVAAVAAYRGVFQTGPRGTSSVTGGSSLATATVNNAAANSWRVVFGAYFSGSASYNISSNEVARRALVDADNSGAVQAAIWDSNAGIATGNTSRTVSRSAAWTAAASVIMTIEPSPGTPASGDLSASVPRLSSAGAGKVHNDAELDAELPSLGFAGDGFGQPPAVDGDVVASLQALSAAGEGGVPVTGTMSATITPSAAVVGETRFFGIRTIVVERDNRTIRVESRAVAD
jgi:hypothetical protein